MSESNENIDKDLQWMIDIPSDIMEGNTLLVNSPNEIFWTPTTFVKKIIRDGYEYWCVVEGHPPIPENVTPCNHRISVKHIDELLKSGKIKEYTPGWSMLDEINFSANIDDIHNGGFQIYFGVEGVNLNKTYDIQKYLFDNGFSFYNKKVGEFLTEEDVGHNRIIFIESFNWDTNKKMYRNMDSNQYDNKKLLIKTTENGDSCADGDEMCYQKLFSEAYHHNNIVIDLSNKKNINESEDFQWMKEINPIGFGELFDNDDICFNKNCDCKICFSDETVEISFDLNEVEPIVHTRFTDDNWFFSVAMGEFAFGTYDAYELDVEEFNYITHYMDNTVLQEFIDVMEYVVFKDSDDVEDYVQGEALLDLERLISDKYISKQYQELIDECVDEMSYVLEKARSEELISEFNDLVNKFGGIKSVTKNGDTINIVVDANKILNYKTFTDFIVDFTYKVLLEKEWSSFYYETFDYHSEEYNTLFNRFNDNVFKYVMRNGDKIKKDKKLVNDLVNLGFKTIVYGGRGLYIIKNIEQYIPKTKQLVIDEYDSSDNTVKIKLYQGYFNPYYNNLKPDKETVVNVDEIPNIITKWT